MSRGSRDSTAGRDRHPSRRLLTTDTHLQRNRSSVIPVTTIRITSVDDELAAAAKAEAARRRLSLSDYLKELIAADLAAVRRRQELYSEIARTAPTHVTRLDTEGALAVSSLEPGPDQPTKAETLARIAGREPVSPKESSADAVRAGRDRSFTDR